MAEGAQRSWYRKRWIWLIAGAGVCLTVTGYLLVPATSSDPADSAEPIPDPTHTTSEVPVDEAVDIAAEDVETADPCGYLDGSPLTELGDVDGDPSAVGLVNCHADVSDTGNIDLSLNSDFETAKGPNGFETHDEQGVTVYEYATTDEDVCWREVAAARNTVISLHARSSDYDRTDCELSDVAIAAVIEVLTSGEVSSWALPEESLARQKACGLVEPSDADRVPGIDMTNLHWTYREQYCTWGEEYGPSTRLVVNFGTSYRGPSNPNSAINWSNIEIGDHDALIAELATNGHQQNGCKTILFYRPLPYSSLLGDTETLEVSAFADQPSEQTCTIVEDITESALNRLTTP